LTEPARKLNLALQGGGAHGAFIWGVLDRLLEDASIEFRAISGTSAAAMNACATRKMVAALTQETDETPSGAALLNRD